MTGPLLRLSVVSTDERKTACLDDQRKAAHYHVTKWLIWSLEQHSSARVSHMCDLSCQFNTYWLIESVRKPLCNMG